MPKFVNAALRFSLFLTLMLLGSVCWSADNADTPAAPTGDKTVTTLDTNIQDLKKQVLDLNRDLFLLEEDLLFPANTQFSVFVSMDVGMMFDLDSVQLKLDNTVVGNHLYTDREINALKRGGVQRFYIGNLTTGEHELVAFFVGKGPKDRDYKRGTTLKFTKGSEAQFVELKITDSQSKLQPEFKAKVWEAE
jgi:hypothetical protein